MSIDETWMNTKMARLRGRAPRGKRPRAGFPHGHWRTTTFLAGLRLSGIDAPMLLDGAINGASFLAYVRQVLVPTLRTGDVIIVDNLGSHKSVAVRRATRKAGAYLLFLPLYRPEPNRAGLRQDQGVPQKDRRPHTRRPFGSSRPRHRSLLKDRVRQLLHRCRL